MKILTEKIKEKNSRVLVGLDPFIDKFPKHLIKGESKKDIADSIIEFNKQIIDAVHDIVPAVKPQCAFYEQFGYEGMRALEETVRYAKEKDLYVIIDGKRNDIGSTAKGYADGYLSDKGLQADSITINGYLGSDGIKPFLDTWKSIFVLAKTSNPSSGEFQNLKLENGNYVYEEMAKLANEWNTDGNVGIVVGATYPEEINSLRAKFPDLFFLIPGYGAQGGKAEDIKSAFSGAGAIVNSSRGILYAWQRNSDEKKFAEAAREEAMRMRDDLNA